MEITEENFLVLRICGKIRRDLTFLSLDPKDKRKSVGVIKLFEEIIAESFLHLARDINLQV